MANILGISAYYHDAAAALLAGGRVIAAAHEERFTRKKHDDSFPINALHYCLKEGGIPLEEVDCIVFYDKPFLKFERILSTFYTTAPRGLPVFLKAMPLWLGGKLNLKGEIRKELKAVYGKKAAKKVPILFSEHHLSHAASAYYCSGFNEAAVLTIDGVGEWATASIMHGKGKELTVLKEMHFPDSLGLLYSAFTAFLGFKVNNGEYKLMGLAPYGDPKAEETIRFQKAILNELINLYDDGSLWLNQHYFRYLAGNKMYHPARWKQLFGMPARQPEGPFNQSHCNLALAIQQVTNKVVQKMAAHAQQLTGSNNLCMAGGVALNCTANGLLKQSGIFSNIFIQPASGDAGGALGAALAVQHLYYGEEHAADDDILQGSYLGPHYSNNNIKAALDKAGAVYTEIDNTDELCRVTAERLATGHIVGWFQGRAEWGPRALGNRSILADPRNSAMQQKLNKAIKFREGFRPFAPAVPLQHVSHHFNWQGPSPFMLYTAPVNDSLLKPLPDDYTHWPMDKKLAFERSELPAITHVDNSARLQTVDKKDNPLFHQLLSAFGALTGSPVLINTSFNVRGEPPVNTPKEAYICFMRSAMDHLVIGNCLLSKTDQPQKE